MYWCSIREMLDVMKDTEFQPHEYFSSSGEFINLNKNEDLCIPRRRKVQTVGEKERQQLSILYLPVVD